MKVRLPNGVEGEGEPADLAEFVHALMDRIGKGPAALPAPATVQAADSDSARTETDAGAGVEVPGGFSHEEPHTPPTEAETRAGIRPPGYDFDCDLCDRARLTERGLKTHKRLVHGVIAAVPAAEQAPRPFRCPHCDFASTLQRGLTRHIRHEHDETYFPGDGGAPAAAEPAGSGDVRLPPEPPAQPATKTRLTSKAVAQCVAAILDGRPVEEWADKWRFRGNVGALGAWARAVARSTDRAAYMALDEEAREEFVARIIRTRGGTMA